MFCQPGFMLKAGTTKGGVTPYTCIAGTTDNCYAYNETGTLDQCKFCEVGFVMDGSYECAAGTEIASCWLHGWDGAASVCGVCNSKTGSGGGTPCEGASGGLPNPSKGCLDGVVGNDAGSCVECAWMFGYLNYEFVNDDDGSL